MIAKIKFYLTRKALERRITGIEVGKNSVIEYPNNLQSDGYLYIGPEAYWALKGGVSIGKNVIFGPRTVLWTYNHDYKSSHSIPYGGEDILKKITIGENCWIGFGAIILPGTQIGEGCIVAAGSVVSGQFGSNLLIGGNPAKIIKELDKDRYRELKQKEALYLVLKKR